MTRWCAALFAMVLGLCTSLGAESGASALQEGPPVGEDTERPSLIDESLREQFRQARATWESTPDDQTSFVPDVWCPLIKDETTQRVCWEAYRASLKYYETGLSHRTRVIRWQHVSTRVIFIAVLMLVAVGLFFAWLQFRHDLRTPRQPQGDTTVTAHSLELSTTGMKLSSPVLGVIILGLSLAFFYLYLVHVYPITETF